MFTLLKRLAILVALWLGVSVAGVVYLNTRSPEMIENDVRAVLEPTLGSLDQAWQSFMPEPGPPLPADDAMRVETQTTLAEVEALYDELIAVHHALQEAHTDQWEKRWAGDAVTLAQMDKERAIEAIQHEQHRVDHPYGLNGAETTPQGVSLRLDLARQAAAGRKWQVENELATARQKLAALNAAPQE